jgi:hypothetical protein
MSIYLLDWFKFPSYGEVNFFSCRDQEYLWQVPPGVTQISAVLIGGGGSGGGGGNQTQGTGGSGAGLRYINGMPVQPGEILKIRVGCGGTGIFCGTFQNGILEAFGQNGGFDGKNGRDSYIASDNNANVPGRTGIGGTIIVFAGGGIGGTKDGNAQQVGPTGGTGSTTGTFAWGTIGGGNGGNGGGSGQSGGAINGGGGGAGGYTGNGGNGARRTNQIDQAATNGSGGGGGGGMFTSVGGSSGGGGGGGVGVVWGTGPNGLRADPVFDTNAFVFGAPGQGGSYGADGKATGQKSTANYQLAVANSNTVVTYDADGTALPTEVSKWNYSIGDGIRGFDDAYQDDLQGPNQQFLTRVGGGGQFGGGGGGADASGQETPKSGSGGDGAVRIIFAARTSNTRNYPTNVSLNNSNLLTDYGWEGAAAGPPARANIGSATVNNPVGFTT